MGRDLDHEICILCVVQWCMLWFSAPTRFQSNIGRRRNSNRKIPRGRECGDCTRHLYAFWRLAHTANVHVDKGAAVLRKTPNKEWDVNKEMKGWRMEGRHVLLSFVDNGNEDSDE